MLCLCSLMDSSTVRLLSMFLLHPMWTPRKLRRQRTSKPSSFQSCEPWNRRIVWLLLLHWHAVYALLIRSSCFLSWAEFTVCDCFALVIFLFFWLAIRTRTEVAKLDSNFVSGNGHGLGHLFSVSVVISHQNVQPLGQLPDGLALAWLGWALPVFGSVCFILIACCIPHTATSYRWFMRIVPRCSAPYGCPMYHLRFSAHCT